MWAVGCGLPWVQAASIAIQSVWRGYRGRQTAAERRRELASFVKMMRQREQDYLDRSTSVFTKAGKSILRAAKRALYVPRADALSCE